MYCELGLNWKEVIIEGFCNCVAKCMRMEFTLKNYSILKQVLDIRINILSFDVSVWGLRQSNEHLDKLTFSDKKFPSKEPPRTASCMRQLVESAL